MKLTATIKEACEITGLGKTTLYNLIATKRVESTTVGRRRLIRMDSLERLLEAGCHG